MFDDRYLNLKPPLVLSNWPVFSTGLGIHELATLAGTERFDAFLRGEILLPSLKFYKVPASASLVQHGSFES